MLVFATGTVILASASFGPEWLLFPGRFIVGASVGMAMASGAAWIKQLSADKPSAGPRRATVAVSAGFGGGPLIPKTALTGTFLWAVAGWAPWVFGTVTVSFVTLPVYVAQDVGMKTAYIGALAGVAMIAGMLIQPTAARVAAKGMLPLSVLALGIACAGMLAAAATVWLDNAALVFPSALILGSSYGIMMVAGLREVEVIARAAEAGLKPAPEGRR